MAFKVKLNLPAEELMSEFQDRMCFAVAKVLIDTKPSEYIRDLIQLLSEEEKE